MGFLTVVFSMALLGPIVGVAFACARAPRSIQRLVRAGAIGGAVTGSLMSALLLALPHSSFAPEYLLPAVAVTALGALIGLITAGIVHVLGGSSAAP